MKRVIRLSLILLLLASSLVLTTTGVTHAATNRCVQSSGTNILQGSLAGSNYTISVPSNWNGTLLLYNHGLVLPGQPLPNPAQDAPDTTAETELLQQGFALAGASFSQVGWAVQQAFQEDIALLDFYAATCGQPARTIVWGGSMGGLITAGLAQLYPQRFAGALPLCGVLSGGMQFLNQDFDSLFAMNVLLANNSLPNGLISDPASAYNQALTVLTAAQQTPQGRARIALASALSDTPGWYDPLSTEPASTDFTTQEQNQFTWFQVKFILDFFAGADIQSRAGGNPFWNLGVDYRQQLLRSVNTNEVVALYQQAGLDLGKDLASLAAAPRVRPDPQAVAYMNNYISLNGQLHIPVLTMHTTGDGFASNQNEQAYASVVYQAGDSNLLRQVFIHRAFHCSFTSAEELTALHALIHRIDTGRWDWATDPDLLNKQAAALGPTANTVPPSFASPGGPMPPAFVSFRPAPFLRPENSPPHH